MTSIGHGSAKGINMVPACNSKVIYIFKDAESIAVVSDVGYSPPGCFSMCGHCSKIFHE